MLAAAPSESFLDHSGVEIECWFEDRDGAPVSPSTIQWRLYCVTTKKILTDWEAATLQSESENGVVIKYYANIVIDGEYNAIQNTRNKRELKRVLIVADKDQPRECSQEETYYIVNTQTR